MPSFHEAQQESVGRFLQRLRLSVPMTRQKLAESIGKSAALISLWENDTRLPTKDVYDLLVQALSLSEIDARLLKDKVDNARSAREEQAILARNNNARRSSPVAGVSAASSEAAVDASPTEDSEQLPADWLAAAPSGPSTENLSADARTLLRRAALAESWTRDALRQVCMADMNSDRLDTLLEELSPWIERATSLEVIAAGRTRYALLAPLRPRCMAHLLESGELEPKLGGWLDWWVTLVEQAEDELIGQSQVQWLTYLEEELPNIRSAIEHALKRPDRTWGLRMVGALWRFYMIHNQHREEGLAYAQAALACASAHAGTREWARVLRMASILLFQRGNAGDTTAARDLARQSLVTFRKLKDRVGAVDAAHTLCGIYVGQGHYRAARRYGRATLHVAKAMGDEYRVANAHVELGHIAYWTGDLSAAANHYAQSAELHMRRFNLRAVAVAYSALGQVKHHQDDYHGASQILERSRLLYTWVRDDRGLANTLGLLGDTAIKLNDPAMAARYLHEALNLRVRIALWPAVISSMDGTVRFARTQRMWTHAIRLLGALQTGRNALGSRAPSDGVQPDSDDARFLREQVGDTAYEQALAEGRRMTAAEAIAYTRLVLAGAQ